MTIKGELITETFAFDGGREVTAYLPPATPDSVVFAADGGWHIAALTDALEASPRRATMIVAVHGMTDDDGRLAEYVPGFDAERSAAFEAFFVDDVCRWVQTALGVALPAARTAIWGASLGGELALALGLRHPEVFGAVLSLSPGGGYQPPPVLPSSLPRVYLLAGTQEPCFLENATRWAAALREAHADVVLMERDGAHGGAFWIEELPRMLRWAFESR
jgi:enterochelin esterase-like enzyme